LSPQERERIIATMDSDEFCNQPPSEIYQTLLERGVHLCSVSTMHRLLRQRGENGERRAQRAPQHHAVPRLVAQAPNEVWTWDCVRHEALSDRAAVKDRSGSAVAAAGYKLRAA
jgi:putative transposase